MAEQKAQSEGYHGYNGKKMRQGGEVDELVDRQTKREIGRQTEADRAIGDVKG